MKPNVDYKERRVLHHQEWEMIVLNFSLVFLLLQYPKHSPWSEFSYWEIVRNLNNLGQFSYSNNVVRLNLKQKKHYKLNKCFFEKTLTNNADFHFVSLALEFCLCCIRLLFDSACVVKTQFFLSYLYLFWLCLN